MDWGFNFGGGKIFGYHPDGRWVLPSLMYKEFWVYFLGGKAAGE
jgi:hypothetical protein